MATKTATSPTQVYVVLESVWDYNDEYYFEGEGYRMAGGIFTSQAAAEAYRDERNLNDMRGLRLYDYCSEDEEVDDKLNVDIKTFCQEVQKLGVYDFKVTDWSSADEDDLQSKCRGLALPSDVGLLKQLLPMLDFGFYHVDTRAVDPSAGAKIHTPPAEPVDMPQLGGWALLKGRVASNRGLLAFYPTQAEAQAAAEVAERDFWRSLGSLGVMVDVSSNVAFDTFWKGVGVRETAFNLQDIFGRALDMEVDNADENELRTAIAHFQIPSTASGVQVDRFLDLIEDRMYHVTDEPPRAGVDTSGALDMSEPAPEEERATVRLLYESLWRAGNVYAAMDAKSDRDLVEEYGLEPALAIKQSITMLSSIAKRLEKVASKTK